jgi:hypothetical protein
VLLSPLSRVTQQRPLPQKSVVSLRGQRARTKGRKNARRVWQDLHHGARMLVKNSGFSLIAAIRLAAGIGANTAVFTVVKGGAVETAPVHNRMSLSPLTPAISAGPLG